MWIHGTDVQLLNDGFAYWIQRNLEKNYQVYKKDKKTSLRKKSVEGAEDRDYHTHQYIFVLVVILMICDIFYCP